MIKAWANKKMRILCLHGRRQSGVTLAKKLFDGSLCELEQKANQTSLIRLTGYDFVFIDGPYVATADLPKLAKARQVSCDMFSWWGDSSDDGSRALEAIDRAQTSLGAFDAVLGFSQGGALAASLCRNSSKMQPVAAIFLSAYYFDGFPLPVLIKPRAGEPVMEGIHSLHVWGEKDQVVSPNKSKELCEWMKGDAFPIQGGHAAPPPPWAENVLVKWLDDKFQNSVKQII